MEPCATCQSHPHARDLARALLILVEHAGLDVHTANAAGEPVGPFLVGELGACEYAPLTAAEADIVRRALARARVDA